ncbi:MAG: Asr1405/Asl0597 family protein [Pseudanabaenaceae cyanobacterium]
MQDPSRWLVYYRLQELDIPCVCGGGQPLKIEANTPTQLVQAWSVFKQFKWQREKAIAWLEQCWQTPYP